MSISTANDTTTPAVNDTAIPAVNPTARIALVGDRSEAVRSHARIPGLLEALRLREGLDLDAYWIPTEEAGEGMDGFDAVWVLPGSPYRSEGGVLTAIQDARENGIPFLGTCAGFQHALLEFARTVCGLDRAGHAENDPGAAHEDAVVVPLACSLVGHEDTVRLTPAPGPPACSAPTGPGRATTATTARTRSTWTSCGRTA